MTTDTVLQQTLKLIPKPNSRAKSRESRAAAADMFGSGVPVREIAQTLGLSFWTVRDWHREWRNGAFHVDVRCFEYSPEDKEKVMKLRDEGCTWSAISRMTGIKASTVQKWLRLRATAQNRAD